MARTGRPVTPTNARFLEKVSQTDGCWTWGGYVDPKGYGVFGINSRQLVKAHRFSYELHVGPIPEGMQLDHLCRVRHCVNPAHLEPVTNRENVIRGNAARPQRQACQRGHPFDEQNTYIDHKGRRQCRACRRAAVQRYQSREKAIGTRN